MLISSLTNPKVKAVVSLRNHKKREALGLSIVEGVREVRQALDSKAVIKEAYIIKEDLFSPPARIILTKLRSLKIPVYEATRPVFEKISYGDRNEGMLAMIETPQYSLKNLKVSKQPFYIVVEKVEKPGNLGAILRTCDGAGVDGVIVCDERTDLFNPNVIRSSLGAIFSVKTVSCSLEEALDFLRNNGIKIFAALPQAKKVYTECDLKVPAAIVVGSEQDGLSDFWKNNADLGIVIPMKGKVDSLNVSVSTAVIVYEALRQRR